jgi:hypothetical protein
MKKCVCRGCGDKWTLDECSASFDLSITLLNQYSSPQLAAWALRAEQDHLLDLRGATGAIRRAGQTAEDELRSQTFSSQAACEIRASVIVRAAMDNALSSAYWDSSDFWDHGLHTYSNPGRRP